MQQQAGAVVDAEEWSWRDLVVVLWRHWWLIAIVTVAAGALTAGAVTLMPRSYGAVVSLKLGHVGEHRLYDAPEVAVQATSYDLGQRLAAAGLYRSGQPDQLADQISCLPGNLIPGTDLTLAPSAVQIAFVTIRAQAGSMDEAVKLAGAVRTLIIREHQKHFDETVAVQRRYRDRLRAEIAALEAERRTGGADDRSGGRLASSAGLFTGIWRDERSFQFQTLDRELRDMDLMLTAGSEMTVSLGEPVALRKLTTPRRTMVTAGGTLMGLLLGVFWTLLFGEKRPSGGGTGARASAI